MEAIVTEVRLHYSCQHSCSVIDGVGISIASGWDGRCFTLPVPGIKLVKRAGWGTGIVTVPADAKHPGWTTIPLFTPWLWKTGEYSGEDKGTHIGNGCHLIQESASAE